MSMKATDLRTGNIILRADNVSEANWATIKLCEQRNKQFNEDFKPVQLTDEWMTKLGFAPFNRGKWEHGVNPVEIYWNQRLGFYYGNAVGISLEHVHQLQNLYFALTGTELTIKP